MCYSQVQQISKRLDTEVCNVRTARRPDENKENTDENKRTTFKLELETTEQQRI